MPSSGTDPHFVFGWTNGQLEMLSQRSSQNSALTWSPRAIVRDYLDATWNPILGGIWSDHRVEEFMKM